MYETKSKGYHIRSRGKWVEFGERSSSYLLGLEKARQSANCIGSLKDRDGAKHYDDVGILKVVKSFYKDLYNSKASDDDIIDQYFELLDKERSFNDIDSSVCEGLIKKEECTLAVNKREAQ